MPDEVDKYLKNFLKAMPSEDLYFEAIHDIMKDLVKEYIKRKIYQNESIKAEIMSILEKFLESKFKEYDALARMAKVTAQIGLITAPTSIKDEAVSDLMNTFRKEIEEIIKKTF
ncbi:MAG: nitrite reductase [Candidatus Thermoplasmatota archaeon]|nr:nitrite reductase [Candidatus Thermoplasmatota archaeon]MCL5955048.1 nitrite reductase [Candidatus Thermoplasmatota archaeon]